MDKEQGLILEAWELRGRINSLENKVGEANDKVAKAQADVNDAESDKEQFLQGKQDAEDALTEAKKVVKACEASLESAKTSLEKAKGEETIKSKILSEYSEEQVQTLDISILECTDYLEETEKERKDLIGKIDGLKSQLDKSLSVLAEQGIDLAFGSPKPQPKVTSI